MSRFIFVMFFVLPASFPMALAAESTAVADHGHGIWTLRQDGADRFRFRFGTAEKPLIKPYFDVFATLEGRNILRDAPADHVHHHALMFAIKIDDVNFWEEYGDFGREVFVQNTLRTDAKESVEGDVIRTATAVECKLDWIGPDDKTLLHENRKVIRNTAGDTDHVFLDWTSTFTLPEGKPSAKLGGNHYHGLGMRFDRTMDDGGRFFSDRGDDQNETVRGTENLTECRWMAYTAKLHGKPVTVAIFDAPENFRKMRAFTMGGRDKIFAYLSATTNLHREPVTMTAEKPVVFRYGIALWEGERSTEEVEKVYELRMKSSADRQKVE